VQRAIRKAQRDNHDESLRLPPADPANRASFWRSSPRTCLMTSASGERSKTTTGSGSESRCRLRREVKTQTAPRSPPTGSGICSGCCLRFKTPI
jgi:hypothetical protein